MPTRRETVTGIAAAVLLNACGEPIIFQREQPQRKENFSRNPDLGDAISYHGIPCLLRANTGMRIQDLHQYLRNSKAAEYGRKYFDSLPDYVLEDIIDRFPPQSIDVGNVFDDFSGQLRKAMPNGGEMNVYFGGMWTSRGFPLDGAIKLDKDPFVEIRRKLMEFNWQLFNSSFFTYDAVGLKEYRREDTLRPVPENIRAAIAFLGLLERWFPFVQFNIIAHSLGGIFALEAVKRHMDIVNNLILIDVPFGGLDTSADDVKEVLSKMKISLEDNPVTYLDRAKKDKNRQKDLDRFGEEFTGKGRKLRLYKSEGDPITKDSKDIKGAKLFVLEGGGHGTALENEEANDDITQAIGPNLAAVA